MVSSNEARAASRARLAGFGFTLPAVAWILLFFGAPLVIMAVMSLLPLTADGSPPQLSFKAYSDFFSQPAYVEAIWNSVVTTVITVFVSLLLAYPFAYVLAYKVPKRWQRFALACAILPFWTSYVVRSYAWLLVLAPTGIVNWLLINLGLIERPITFAYNPNATVLGFVHFFIMLNALTIYANLVQINPRYVLAAQDLGASAWKSFLAVTLPLSVPGMTVGAFLTVVLCIGDFITPQILGGNKELLLPQVIMMQIQRQLDLPMASVMSLVLTVIVAAVYLLIQKPMRSARL
ncbi:ABC transporter permease [Dongia sp.]|uniref:ABC transporter permease n=1 Tax=Dongia sp. TaxID=1977262 RepID=UPI00375210F0